MPESVLTTHPSSGCGKRRENVQNTDKKSGIGSTHMLPECVLFPKSGRDRHSFLFDPIGRYTVYITLRPTVLNNS